MRFIRLLLFLLLMASAGAVAQAETHYKARLSAGVRGGVTLARQDLSPSVPQRFVMGSTGAVTFRYTEEKLFGLVAEFGWVQRGWEEDFEESPLRYSRKLTYLTLPVMTQIIFGGRRAKCFINLGPEFSYMIGEKIDANFNYNDLSTVTDWPERKRMTEQLGMKIANKFDYGITAGLGAEGIIKRRHSVMIEARLYYGLGNIYPSSKKDTFSASRNISIAVTLGYMFRLK